MRRLFGLRRVGGALPDLRGAAGQRGLRRTCKALPGLRGAAERVGRCRACGALPDGAGFAFDFAAPKKA